MEEDTRNVIDVYKGVPIEAIIADLDTHGVDLEIAVENVARDYNMGTIVRSANAFGVRHLHIIGSRQWNKRGAMMTDKYLHVHYYDTVTEFMAQIGDKVLIAVDNVDGSIPLSTVAFPRQTVMVFGAEGPGLTKEITANANMTVAIEQFGSTRSMNVGVAAGVAMYAWVQQHTLRG